MGNKLTVNKPSAKADLEIYGNLFMIPSDWKSCGPVVYISGATEIYEGQPIALALTPNEINICNFEGPQWSLPLCAV